MAQPAIDYRPGARFGRLTIVGRAGSDKGGHALWTVLCDCGNGRTVQGNNLRRGLTKSCGCLQRENSSQFSAGANNANRARKAAVLLIPAAKEKL
jgi:hypothetical protein